MAYRPYEYVPEVHRPNDSRLSELIYLQGQNQAQQMRQQGVTNALMWQGIGRAGSGMLSDLATYKREEPARREAERVRREQDKLRGLEQMAGAGGMDEEARGKLLKQEGFAEKGQEILDRNMSRKATQANYDDAQQRREEKIAHEITQQIYGVQGAKDPAAEWKRILPGLRKKAGDKVNFDEEYNAEKVGQFLSQVEKPEDRIQQTAGMKAEYERGQLAKAPEEQAYKEALTMANALLPNARTPEAWASSWQRIMATLPDDPALREKVLAKIPFDQQYSPQAAQFAREITGDKNKPSSALEMSLNAFIERTGREPRTQAEVQSVVMGAHVPATGGSGMVDARRRETQKYQANKEKNDKLFELEKQFRNGEIDETMLAQGKEATQQWYLSTIGAEGGPTLAQIEGGRGRDVVGRPLAAQAQPGAARPQAPRPPAGGTVMMQSPDGQELREVPAADAEYYVSKGGRIVPGRSQQQAPAAPATPPAPAVAPSPALPTEAVDMVAPDGRYKKVGPQEIQQYLDQKWKILPPPKMMGQDFLKRIGGEIMRDMTTGAPPRQAAPSRR